MPEDKYGSLGVDAEKSGVAKTFQGSTENMCEFAFCNVQRHPRRADYVCINHPDGAGSKSVQNYVNWKETGNEDALRGSGQDAFAMNVGDILCTGLPDWISFTDYIAINAFNLPKGLFLQKMNEDFSYCKELMGREDIPFYRPIRTIFAGGETADLPDQLTTNDVVVNMYAEVPMSSILTGERVSPTDFIIGIPSGGQASYEKRPAGSLMSNGLTLGRHCLMSPEISEKYPEIGENYYGPYTPTDTPKELGGVSVGEELTRPTRIFAPIFQAVRHRFGDAIHGIVFNTGGGNTKCRNLGHGLRYVKNNMPEESPIFRLIQRHGEVSWEEMYRDYNMRVGAEFYVAEGAEDEVPEFVNEEFNLPAQRIGRVRSGPEENAVRIETSHGSFEY